MEICRSIASHRYKISCYRPLAAVLHGIGGAELLDSYEAERRPVGLRNRAGSGAHMQARRKIFALYGEAGVYASGELDEQARGQLGRAIAAIGNAENESTGIELGYSYAGSPVVCTDPSEAAPDDPRRYQPSTVPGVRLPNVVLEDGTPLHDRLGMWFTLLAVQMPPSEELVKAAARRGLPLEVIQLKPSAVAIYGRGQLLVRPDQHIAWRGADELAAVDADGVMHTVLGGVPA